MNPVLKDHITDFNNFVIAPTQFAAAVFNLLTGASDIVTGVEQIARLTAWSGALAGTTHNKDKLAVSRKIVERSVSSSLVSAWFRVLAGLIQLVFAACFVVLGCNTIKDSHTFHQLGPRFAKNNIEELTWDALAAMDVGLLYFIWCMWSKYRSSVVGERRFNKLAELLDTAKLGSRDDGSAIVELAQAAGFDEADLPEAYLAMMPASAKHIWLSSANAGAASVKKALSSVEDSLDGLVDSKQRSDAAYKLRILAYEAGNAAPADLTFLVLNCIAWYGYMLGIIASKNYFPDRDIKGKALLVQPWHNALKFGMKHADSAWWGNLAGDSAWTIEPLLVIVSAYLSAPISVSNGAKATSVAFTATSTTPNHRGRGKSATPTSEARVGASPSPAARGRSKSPKATKAAPKRSASKSKKA